MEKVYAFEPLDKNSTAHAASLLGIQAQVWTEYIKTPEAVERAAFPRLCAFSEVAWTDSADKSFSEFERRLRAGHLRRLDAHKVAYWRGPGVLGPTAVNSRSPDGADDETPSAATPATGPIFYVAQRLAPGSVVGKRFVSEDAAKNFFETKVCPEFATILMDSGGRILDFWGGEGEEILRDFGVWIKQDLEELVGGRG